MITNEKIAEQENVFSLAVTCVLLSVHFLYS